MKKFLILLLESRNIGLIIVTIAVIGRTYLAQLFFFENFEENLGSLEVISEIDRIGDDPIIQIY